MSDLLGHVDIFISFGSQRSYRGLRLGFESVGAMKRNVLLSWSILQRESVVDATSHWRESTPHLPWYSDAASRTFQRPVCHTPTSNCREHWMRTVKISSSYGKSQAAQVSSSDSERPLSKKQKEHLFQICLFVRTGTLEIKYKWSWDGTRTF